MFVRVGNFQRDSIEIDLTDAVFVRPPTGPETERTALQENDVLITITADVGMVGGVDSKVFSWGQAYINQHVCLARPVIPEISHFMGYALASQPGQKQIEERQYGATKKGLALDDVKELVIPLPPLAEQRHIVAEVERRLSVAREAEKAVEANLKRIARLRQAILKRAFEGKLVPQNPNDESAEKLLARIQSRVTSSEITEHRRKSKVKDKKQRQSLYEVLSHHETPLSPRELLFEAGFDEHTIEDFYEELYKEVVAGRIREIRTNAPDVDKDIRLEAVKHES